MVWCLHQLRIGKADYHNFITAKTLKGHFIYQVLIHLPKIVSKILFISRKTLQRVKFSFFFNLKKSIRNQQNKCLRYYFKPIQSEMDPKLLSRGFQRCFRKIGGPGYYLLNFAILSIFRLTFALLFYLCAVLFFLSYCLLRYTIFQIGENHYNFTTTCTLNTNCIYLGK